MEKKKNSLTVTLSGHQGPTEGLRGLGPGQSAPPLLTGSWLWVSTFPSPQSPHLEQGTTESPHSIHEIKGEMLTQAQHKGWCG